MNTFKVGDIVTGTELAECYCVTGEGWTGKVVASVGNLIKVTDSIGKDIFEVSALRFRLATDEEKIKAGLILPKDLSSRAIDLSSRAIKNVIFNAPATIVLWNDGTKTVVKCGEGEKYDPEKGLALCIAKKALGNNYEYYEPFKKYLGKYHKKESKKVSAKKPVATTTKTKKPVAKKAPAKKTGTRKSTSKK